MAIAMSFLYNERTYYYESDGIESFFVSGRDTADLTIIDLPFGMRVSFNQGVVEVRLSAAQAYTVPMNQFVMLDEITQLIVYATQLTDQDQIVQMAKNGQWLVGSAVQRPKSGEPNHIVIKRPFVSAAHCRIQRENGVTVVIDDNSANGIFLNGVRVKKAVVRDGDVLSVFTVQMILQGDCLVIKNAADGTKAKKLRQNIRRKSAPKKAVKPADVFFSRSPRMLASLRNQDIALEKPPQSGGKPQMNWLSILITPIITVLLMVVLVFVMGMNAMMLIMSGTMSVVSAVVAVINYKKQKSKYQDMESLVDEKYRAYLQDVSRRIESNKKSQRNQLVGANPNPNGCIVYAKSKDRHLWERTPGDQDFLHVRIGTGTIPSALTASYKQSEVVITETELDVAAKKVAEDSRFVEYAPILCDLAKGKQLGIVGNRADEEQLVRNMIVQMATAHSYDEVKLVVLTTEDDAALWSWTRWLPHCADNYFTERYIFTSMDEAEATLDSISETLGRRTSKEHEYGQPKLDDRVPHYVFLVLHRQLIETHPIRKHLFSPEDNGCSCVFVYDSISWLPKECNDIIEVRNGNGEFYDRHNVSAKTAFRMDEFTLENADLFARTLAPLRVQTEGQAAALPSSMTFLDGYGVARPEQLDIAKRWKAAKPYKSLAVPVAAMAGGTPFCFDIHEKRHGVNGIVAGMPGSGKTEMVQSWLLSLAVNYSPQDVSFVLVDFKGTGMIAPFRNIPHLAGSISNLDTNIDRNLVAIQSEVHRREAIIDKYSNKSVKNINDLNKAYEKGLVPEKLPILLVVIDEYAEFKKIFPDFGAEIDSLTSKGRALGIFVVLMTQKPAGVVSAKSEDNIKFRWCLRVANYSASREMLGRTDAAKISVPGRAYVKVGEDDVYEQVQSYWSGAPYIPNKAETKKENSVISFVRLDGKRVACEQQANRQETQSDETQIDAVVRYITEFCEQQQIPSAEKIWTEKLPESIALHKVLKKRFDAEKGWPASTGAAPAVGLLDDPEKQAQYPLVLDFAKLGHIVLYGAPVSGKTTFLQTLIMSVAMSCSPEVANIYAMDFGGWSLNVFKDLPHVGGIANDNEPDRIKKLVILLTDILEARKEKFAAVGVGNIAAYRQATGEKLPDVLVIVDNFGAALKLYPGMDEFFGLLTGSGANYGIYLVATAVASNAVPMRIAQNIKYALALQLIEKVDYTYIVGRVSSEVPPIAGRGYAKGKPPLMFQTALPAKGANEKEITTNIRKTAAVMNERWTGEKATQIPEMPARIPYGSVKTRDVCLGLTTDKVVPVGVDFAQQHFLMISGMPKSGKTNLLCAIVKQIKETAGGVVYSLDVSNGASLRELADRHLTTAQQIDAFIDGLRPQLQQRLETKQKDPNAAFETMTFVIDDYSRFFEQVSNDSIDRLFAVIKLGNDLGLRLVAASDAYGLSAMVNKGEKIAVAMVRSDCAVMLGGCASDHASINTKMDYTSKSVQVDEFEGYLVQKMKCIRFKAMYHLGE